MGWWKTDNGHVLGDPALDILDQFQGATDCPSVADLPDTIRSAITAEYQVSFGRDPTPSELSALLAFWRGDGTQGVIAKAIGLPPREPG